MRSVNISVMIVHYFYWLVRCGPGRICHERLMLIVAECISHNIGLTAVIHPFKFLFDDLMFSNIFRDLNSSSTPGTEPFDPGLSSLPPELAFQEMVAGYITVGTLAVSC